MRKFVLFGLGVTLAATLGACNGAPVDEQQSASANRQCVRIMGSHLSCRTGASSSVESTTDTHGFEKATRNVGNGVGSRSGG
jgi:hypothetical protein